MSFVKYPDLVFNLRQDISHEVAMFHNFLDFSREEAAFNFATIRCLVSYEFLTSYRNVVQLRALEFCVILFGTILT